MTPTYMLWASMIIQSIAFLSLDQAKRDEMRQLLRGHRSMTDISDDLFAVGQAMIATGPGPLSDSTLWDTVPEFTQTEDADA